jgi:hypothetical protein
MGEGTGYNGRAQQSTSHLSPRRFDSVTEETRCEHEYAASVPGTSHLSPRRFDLLLKNLDVYATLQHLTITKKHPQASQTWEKQGNRGRLLNDLPSNAISSVGRSQFRVTLQSFSRLIETGIKSAK